MRYVRLGISFLIYAYVVAGNDEAFKAEQSAEGEIFAESPTLRFRTESGRNPTAEVISNEYANENGSRKVLFVHYACNVCGVRFKSDRAYTTHYLKEHKGSKPHSCPECAFKCTTKAYLMNHIDFHHPGKYEINRGKKGERMTCELCRLECAGAMAFQKHALTSHEGVKMMKCSECEAKFFRNGDLTVHIKKKHRSDVNFSLACGFCRNNFQRSDQLEHHVGVCENRRAKKMIVGEFKICATEIENMNVRAVCHKCGGKFPSLTILKEHFKSIHEDAKATFLCNVCGISFAGKTSLERHHKKYHLEEGEDSLLALMDCRRNLQFVCKCCGEEFVGVTRYEAHGISAHPRERFFRCDVCDDGFQRKALLLLHVRTKHGDANFRCRHCLNFFALVGEKNRHEKRCEKAKEAGNAPFYCGLCRKTLRCTSEATHFFKHEKYEHCPFCDKRFHRHKNPKGLTAHVRLRHPNESINVNAFERAARILKCDEEEN